MAKNTGKENGKASKGRRQTKDHVFTDLFDQKEYQKLLYAVLHPEDRKGKYARLTPQYAG